MRGLPLILAAAIGLAALPAPHAGAQPGAAQPGIAHERRFVDFRSRPGALWGHTYIVYGRIGPDGRPAELHTAGLYPDGGREGLIAGSLVPVPARVRAVPGDYRERPNAVYRRSLSRGDYARLKAAVRHARDRERHWHMLMHNCNAFAVYVAEAIGLSTPPSLLLPNAFVRALAAMND